MFHFYATVLLLRKFYDKIQKETQREDMYLRFLVCTEVALLVLQLFASLFFGRTHDL